MDQNTTTHRSTKTIDKEIAKTEAKLKQYRAHLSKLIAEKEATILSTAPDANTAIAQLITLPLPDIKEAFPLDPRYSGRHQDTVFYETRTADGGVLKCSVSFHGHSNWQKAYAGEKQVVIQISGSFKNGAATCLKTPWNYHVRRTKTVKNIDEARAALAKLLANCQKHLKEQLQ